MDTSSYLSRLGIQEEVSVDLAGLEMLQRAHLTAIPFENLDVYHRRGVHTGTEWSVPKITERGRGGWCYELNGAFVALLEALGFEVTRLGATVLVGGSDSEVLDHMTVGVELDRRYLVDVGFGDSFIRPLPVVAGGPFDGGTGLFGFSFEGGTVTLLEFDRAGNTPQFKFDWVSREPSDFDRSSHRLQTEPGLHWTESPFATRLLDRGPDRVTLLKNRIKFRRNGQWTEHAVPNGQWAAALAEWFEMTP